MQQENQPAGGTAAPAQTTDTSNLRYYNALKSVPQEAQKPITDGRLAGKTDINPMWRIKALTELFGPCSIGWKVEVTHQWLEKGDDNTIAAFVNVNLYIKDPKTGQWGEPIPGNGGNIFQRKERSGNNYVDDDCYKKAESDAIGSAAKKLGVGADIYWEQDATKYTALASQQGDTGTRQATVHSRPSQTKENLSPQSRYWNQSVAIAMNTSDPLPKIRQRIEAKYTISDQDFTLLMKQAGKATQKA